MQSTAFNTDEREGRAPPRIVEAANTGTRKQVGRFLIVGLTTVAIDLLSYLVCLAAGVSVSLAKAIGFSVGTVFAYFANRTWTFEAKNASWSTILPFVFVYGATLLANVAANRFVLWIAGDLPGAILGAFLCATGLSATLNFLGMKYVVFKSAGSTRL